MIEYDILQPFILREAQRKNGKSHWLATNPVVVDIFQNGNPIFLWQGKSRVRRPYVIHRIDSCIDNTFLQIEPQSITVPWIGVRKATDYGIYRDGDRIDLISIIFETNKNTLKKYAIFGEEKLEILFDNRDKTVTRCFIPNVCDIAIFYDRKSIGLEGKYTYTLKKEGEVQIHDERYLWLGILMIHEFWYGLYTKFYNPNGTFYASPHSNSGP